MSESPATRHFDLLSLDTQVVDQAGYAFDSGLLAQLRQFKGRRKRIVLADIVVREITGHVAQWLRNARGKLEIARGELAKTGILPEELAQHVDSALDEDVQAEAEKRVQRFVDDIGAEIVSADLVKGGRLAEAYFTVTPPFAANKNKKSEFPDAIALFSMEEFAVERNQRILAVSNDSGWAAFADRSDRIDVVAQLSEALQLAQLHLQGEIEEEQQRELLENANKLVEKFCADVDSGVDEESYLALCSMIEDQLKEGGIEAETSGVVETELESLDLEVRRVSFTKGLYGSFAYQIVRARPGSLAVSADIELELRASAQFSLYGYDSVDKDSFSLGTQSKSGTFQRELSVLLEFEGKPDDDTLTLERVEILGKVVPLDFGDVYPDWGPEHDP